MRRGEQREWETRRERGKQKGDTQRTVWRDATVPVFFADAQQTESGKTEKGEPKVGA